MMMVVTNNAKSNLVILALPINKAYRNVILHVVMVKKPLTKLVMMAT